MIKEHKDFIKAVLVFSILFWGVYIIAMYVLPQNRYYNAPIDPGFGEMLERQGELDESKV